jgi:hypothetical protein
MYQSTFEFTTTNQAFAPDILHKAGTGFFVGAIGTLS